MRGRGESPRDSAPSLGVPPSARSTAPVGAAPGLDCPSRPPLLAASPLFAADWYAEMAGSDPRPLAAARHYLRRGAGLGLHPHPLFAPEHVVVACPALAEGVDPLVSYLETEAFEVSTHPLFDVAAYLADDPAARTHPGGPLVHYAQVGHARTGPPTGGTHETRVSRRDSSTGSSPGSASARSVGADTPERGRDSSPRPDVLPESAIGDRPSA